VRQARPIVAIHVETTGLDPTRDRIVEAGFVRFEDGAVVLAYGSLVDPGIPIPDTALPILRCTRKLYRAAPTIERVLLVARELGMFRDALPCAWHAEFHRAFLHTALRGKQPSAPAFDPRQPWIDARILVAERRPTMPNRRLVKMCAALGIPVADDEGCVAHAGAAGALWKWATSPSSGKPRA
jgi:DNA polymerase III epsilon subunit-like protein